MRVNAIIALCFTFELVCQTLALSESCATFLPSLSTFDPDLNYASAPVILKDGSLLNPADEGLYNQTAGLWKLRSSCSLQLCTGAYLTGNCSSVSSDAFSIRPWQSAKCTCDSGCSCPIDLVKDSVCARAYLKPGGCSSCNAHYTELHPGSHDVFLEKWRNKISSLFVRSGCTITIYDEVDLEGESKVITGPGLQNLSGRLSSYECKCINDQARPTQNLGTRDIFSGPRVDIPNSLDGVVEQLAATNWTHPGLLAALKSLSVTRSSKNVYILVLGSSGAGKSSTINTLLGKNISSVGDFKSTTSDIFEFRIPLPLRALGINNSELRIIDTPGLGDTEGVQNDALFLTTLENYLSTHEELQSRRPNFVIILHRFDDNRFLGQASRFVHMIRAFDTIRPLITDENYSNVLFLFSHMCSVDQGLQRNPQPRLMEFKEIVEKYSFFPKPILTAVAENHGTDNRLTMKNGNFKLPNQEEYPQNVLDKLDRISKRAGDTVGNAIINSDAAQNQDFGPNPNITTILYPMVSKSHYKVAKYLKLLNSFSAGPYNSEVSLMLADAYNEMRPTLKSRFPKALENLQLYLNLKGVTTQSDIPVAVKPIMDLLSGIALNEAYEFLLEKGLKLKAPRFPQSPLVGNSYDIFKNSILPKSPFQLNSGYNSSVVGFSLPEGIHGRKHSAGVEDMLMSFYTQRDYFQHRADILLGRNLSLVANSSKLYHALSGKLEPGYFVNEIKCNNGKDNVYCFTITRMYNMFHFNLEPTSLKLLPEFVSRIEKLPDFKESNSENVEMWSRFFVDYGTHVVTSSVGGGRIDIQFMVSGNISVVNFAVKKVLSAIHYAENPLESALTLKEDFNKVLSDSLGMNYQLAFRGGDNSYHVQSFAGLSLERASTVMNGWKKSLVYFPVAFPKDIQPIGKVVASYFPQHKRRNVQNKIEGAMERLLSSTLRYVAPTPDPREVEKLQRQHQQREELLREIERRRAEQEEQLRKLEEEKRRKEEEARKLKESESHLKVELDWEAKVQQVLRCTEELEVADLLERDRKNREQQWRQQNKSQQEQLARLRQRFGHSYRAKRAAVNECGDEFRGRRLARKLKDLGICIAGDIEVLWAGRVFNCLSGSNHSYKP